MGARGKQDGNQNNHSHLSSSESSVSEVMAPSRDSESRPTGLVSFDQSCEQENLQNIKCGDDNKSSDPVIFYRVTDSTPQIFQAEQVRYKQDPRFKHLDEEIDESNT